MLEATFAGVSFAPHKSALPAIGDWSDFSGVMRHPLLQANEAVLMSFLAPANYKARRREPAGLEVWAGADLPSTYP